MTATRQILLTGATGYVGGRLLSALQATGASIKCLTRKPEYLEGRVSPETIVCQGDILDQKSLAKSLQDVDTAYYMIHAIGSAKNFEDQEIQGANNFAQAAKEAGVRRIIYLGGLGNRESEQSQHLRSRHKVGDILRASGLQVIELRASIIIGSGSLSFEMIRSLTEHLPVMIMPKWVQTMAQPIGINDVIHYLLATLEIKTEKNEIIDIGGPDQLTYGDLIREYATQRNLRRFFIRVPFLTPRISSLWLGLITPLYARIGRALIESIKSPTIIENNRAKELFSIKPTGASEAIRAALANEDRAYAETHWSDSIASTGLSTHNGKSHFGNRLIDHREQLTKASSFAVFSAIERLGGSNGWYAFNHLWQIRGFFDLLVGGVGMRRGRPQGRPLRPGDPLDFWRIESIVPNRELKLFAEMKLPGRAWLCFEIKKEENGTRITQTALFDPIGLFGLLYWYSVYPLHNLVFKGMLQAITHTAEIIEAEPYSKTNIPVRIL